MFLFEMFPSLKRNKGRYDDLGLYCRSYILHRPFMNIVLSFPIKLSILLVGIKYLYLSPGIYIRLNRFQYLKHVPERMTCG